MKTTNQSTDSRPDTEAHIARVKELLLVARENLLQRAFVHDASKLEEPEKSAFDIANARLSGSTYGSDEYKGFLADLKPALDHHYAANSHHPEHYRKWKCPLCETIFSHTEHAEAPQGPNDSGNRYCPRCCPVSIIYECQLFSDNASGINGMSLLDLLEMLCDWKAAGERHKDGSMARSLYINQGRFGIDDQLQSILTNTAIELGWLPLHPSRHEESKKP